MVGSNAACNHRIEDARPVHVHGKAMPMGCARHILDGGKRPYGPASPIDGLLNRDDARAGSVMAPLAHGRIDLGAGKNPALSC
jgi:hypothetical protein